MFRGEKTEVVEQLRSQFAQGLERAQVLNFPASGPPAALVGSIFDELVLFDEIAGDGPIASRSLVQAAAGSGGMTFGDWLAPPRKRPRLIVLPGLQTAMAGGLEKLPARPGDDVFVAATDLLAAGSTTAVMSRWRMGGKIAADLTAEFLRDVSAAAADGSRPAPSTSWQRAVDVATAEQPDPEREPRLRLSPKAVPTDAKHPFFWAGYLLIDCGAGIYADAPAKPAVR
jgi:hypothetical protein